MASLKNGKNIWNVVKDAMVETIEIEDAHHGEEIFFIATMLRRGRELGDESKAVLSYGGRILHFLENLLICERLGFKIHMKVVNHRMMVIYHLVENLPSSRRINFRENGEELPYVHNEVFYGVVKAIFFTGFKIELESKS
ncbi:hypothetical protein Fot_06365 [Forsythia ovata]|uniref:Uncharacterized protein n=1 Tax=Forsythia ovata TaxID=205694 RepID=A0ABD1WSR7_9LAMI